MFNWKPITSDSPTQKQCSDVILVHYFDQYEQNQVELIVNKFDIKEYHSHWTEFISPDDEEDIRISIEREGEPVISLEELKRIIEMKKIINYAKFLS